MSNRTREIDFHVYLSETENEVLNKLCLRMKKDRSKVIRSLIKGVKLVEAPPIDFKEFTVELRRVGTNLNQLTAKANSTGFINAAECKSVLDKVRYLEQEILKYFKPGKGESEKWL